MRTVHIGVVVQSTNAGVHGLLPGVTLIGESYKEFPHPRAHEVKAKRGRARAQVYSEM